MTRQIMRRVSWPVVFAGLAAPFIVNCGAAGQLGALAGAAGGPCPDMNDVEAIEKFDFGANFKLKGEAGLKIKAAAEAYASIKGLAAKVDADLTAACGSLAKDLGDTNSYSNGPDACNAALKAIDSVKAKIGASASINIAMTPPHCGLSVDAYADCAGSCNVKMTPAQLQASCEGGQISGGCSGQCSGECQLTAAASCSGDCSGSCDASFTGSCSGQCNGKCDGKATTGGSSGASCAGKCEGSCSAGGKGQCKGKCGGSCKVSGGASCSGTCSGSCSVAMTAPKCSGTFKPPSMSADCKAKCDAKVQAKAECTPPSITVNITGAADASASAMFTTAIQNDLPKIVATAKGLAGAVGGLKDEVTALVSGVITAGASVSADPMTGGKLMLCLSPLKGMADAAGSLQANVSVSVSVSGHAGVGG